jgi:SAM-dependent methyltransferase
MRIRGEERLGVVDKCGRLGALEPGSEAILELGCGARKRLAHAIGVDARDLPGVDVVGDVFDVLRAVPPASIAEIHSRHFLEHLPSLERFLRDAVRVLRPGGRLEAVVPHFSNPYFYSDPTHHTHFGLYTFSYYARDGLFARRVPRYTESLPLRLAEARLVFRSPAAFRVRKQAKRGLTALVNARRGLQEFYEENLCFWLPCYEIEFTLEREAS